MAKELTPKQRIFVKEYLVDKNATRAAIAAGYSKRSATLIGHENIMKPYISKAIELGLKNLETKIEKRIEKAIMTKEEWMQEVNAIAASDITDLYTMDEAGKLKLSLIDIKNRGLGRLIKKIKYNAKGMPEYELHSKQHAMELLAKARNWITDQVVVKEHVEELTEEDFDEIFKSEENQAWALKLAHATSKMKKPEGEKQ